LTASAGVRDARSAGTRTEERRGRERPAVRGRRHRDDRVLADRGQALDDKSRIASLETENRMLLEQLNEARRQYQQLLDRLLQLPIGSERSEILTRKK
jgi:hypothetical protein